MTSNIRVSPAGTSSFARGFPLMAMFVIGCGFAPQPKSGTVACKPQGSVCCPAGYVCVGRGVSTAGGPSAGTCWSQGDLPPEATAWISSGVPGCLATDWLPPEWVGLERTLDAGSPDLHGPVGAGEDAAVPGRDGSSDGGADGASVISIIGPTATTKLAAGSTRTYLAVNGRLLAWGYNKDGFLGDATTTNRMHPVAVSGLQSGVTTVSTGGGHTCVVVNGGVQCWGNNDHGQLGNNTTSNSGVPVPVVGLGAGTGATAVAAGGQHTCAVVKGGVRCWGNGEYGQLGDNSRVDSLIPAVLLDLPSGVTAIAAGSNHTCALVNGGVRCWGANHKGQLGINTESIGHKVPMAVVGLESGVTAIAAYFWHSCAVVQGGIRCWGNNDSGELGDGTTKLSPVPVQVVKLSVKVADVACGGSRTCALTETGGALCWGGNHGFLGDGTIEDWARYPTQVQDLKNGVRSLAIGGSHGCAVTSAHVKCWGSNTYGEMGVDDLQHSLVPVDVQFL